MLLITCYPFDALLPGGPFRYVVKARAVVPKVISHISASVMTGGGSRGKGMISHLSYFSFSIVALLKGESPYD
jgi:hypothetical protein